MHPFRLLRSTSFRLALVYMALFGVSVLLLLGFLYWATAGYMSRQTDTAIEAEIQGLAEQYRQTGTPGLIGVIRDRITRDPGGASVYLLAGARREPLIGNIDRWPDGKEGPDGWITFELTDRTHGDTAPHSARARQFRLDSGLLLLVGRDVRELEATQALIERALIWGLGVMVLLASIGGGLMSAGLLRRIEAINRTSREIMQGDLSRRVATRGSGDEFDQLAAGLNQMLDRIQELMTSLRQVSDNIAHDLRTPLARLRGRLENALDEDSDPAARREAIETAIQDADGLLATFGALLRIARIEAASETAEPVALDAVAADAVELYAPVAEEKGCRLALIQSEQTRLLGDRDLLFQAVSNLIDNAVKFSPPGETVSVSVGAPAGTPEIMVADHGPGIPAAMRDKVFERFFRLEESRTTPGNGLGLSLVAAVVRRHGAEITLDDNAPGLRVTITFPAQAPDLLPAPRAEESEAPALPPTESAGLTARQRPA